MKTKTPPVKQVAYLEDLTAIEEKAAIAAEIKRRLDSVAGIISTKEPTTVNEMLARQNQLVQKMNILTNPNNQ